jgi:hypothetical protein
MASGSRRMAGGQTHQEQQEAEDRPSGKIYHFPFAPAKSVILERSLNLKEVFLIQFLFENTAH